MKKVLKYSLITIFIFSFIFIQTYRIVGNSMNPNLNDGDFGISIKYISVDRFDIVILEKDQTKMIKRVIGLPNDLIEYKNNFLYVNEQPINEPFETNGSTHNFRFQLKEDEYFVLGDNRSQSLDSRSFGVVKRKEIQAKVIK